MKLAALILALVVTLAPVAADAPETKTDFGGGWFGLEADPPQGPELDLDLSSLGKLLQIDLTGLAAGDDVAGSIGDLGWSAEVLDDRSLHMLIAGTDGTRDVTLPPVDQADSLDMSLLVTPLTFVIDRDGTNDAAFVSDYPRNGGIDEDMVRDVTIPIWGLTTDIDAGTLAKPDTVTATQTLWDYTPGIDRDIATFIVDPEAQLQIITDSTDLDPATLAAVDLATPKTTIADIAAGLQAISVEDLTLNGVLSALKTATEEVGVVDVSDVADSLAEHGIGVKTITDVALDEQAILDIRDPDNRVLAFINGGIGKLVLVDTTVGDIDDDKLTALKDPQSVQNTVFVACHSMRTTDAMVAPGCGAMHVKETIGNYRDLVNQHAEALKRNALVLVKDKLDDCGIGTTVAESQARQATAFTVCGYGVPTERLKQQAMEALENTSLCPVQVTDHQARATHAALCLSPMIRPEALIQKAKDDGQRVLEQLKDVPGSVGGIGTFDPPSVPRGGVGSVDGIRGPDIERPVIDPPSIDAPKVDLLDAIAEHFSAPALPEVAPLIPIEDASGLVHAAFGQAGLLQAIVPYNAIKTLPIGHDSELQTRFIGDRESLFDGVGISDVLVTVTAEDPFGFVTTTSTKQSNTNGYAVFGVPALGSWQLSATHDDYKPLQGSGQSALPGQTTGQQYQMESKESGIIEDVTSSPWTLLVLAVLVVGGAWYYNKNRKKGGRGR